MRLASVDDLRSVYRPPARGPIDKVIHRIDEHCREFVAKSPFFVLSTASGDGTCDISPKGGPPGFVQVLDEQHLAWPDYAGNNRLDSFQNLVSNDSVALLFMIPGLHETLRVNGTAELVTDEELCERLTVGGKPSKVAVVVTVVEAYIHCAKALRRGGIWETESWLQESELPSPVCIIKDHVGLEEDIATLTEVREQNLQKTLWEPGGGS